MRRIGCLIVRVPNLSKLCYARSMSKSLKTPAGQTHPSLAERREKRLEAALRANLKKRKEKGETPPAPASQPASAKR